MCKGLKSQTVQNLNKCLRKIWRLCLNHSKTQLQRNEHVVSSKTRQTRSTINNALRYLRPSQWQTSHVFRVSSWKAWRLHYGSKRRKQVTQRRSRISHNTWIQWDSAQSKVRNGVPLWHTTHLGYCQVVARSRHLHTNEAQTHVRHAPPPPSFSAAVTLLCRRIAT